MAAACCVAVAFFGAIPRAAAAGVAPAEATPEQTELASAKYIEAKKAYTEGRFAAALVGFRASLDVVDSPNTQLMVAKALDALGLFTEAYREARTAARQADAAAGQAKYAATGAAARAVMSALRPQIGLLKVVVSVPDATRLSVGSADIAREDWGTAVPVGSGEVKVALTTPTGVETKTVTVAMGGEASVAFDLTASDVVEGQAAPTAQDAPLQPPEDEGGGFAPFGGGPDQRLVAYIAGGVGATGLTLFGIFGALHLGKHNDLEEACVDGLCQPELADDAESGRAYQTVANVSLVVGLVGVAGGAALFLTSFRGEGNKARCSHSPQIGVGQGTLSLRGTF